MKTTQWHAIFLKLRTPLDEGSVESGNIAYNATIVFMNVRKYFKDPRLIVMSRYYFDQHVLINGNIVQHLKREGKKEGIR